MPAGDPRREPTIGRNDATVLMLDVYRGGGLAGVPRGSVKALRIIDFDVRDTPGSGGLRRKRALREATPAP